MTLDRDDIQAIAEQVVSMLAPMLGAVQKVIQAPITPIRSDKARRDAEFQQRFESQAARKRLKNEQRRQSNA